MCSSPGRSAIFTTFSAKPLEHVWQTVLDQDTLVFKVSACIGGVRIVLSSFIRNAETRFYLIILGGERNTISMIGKDGLDDPNLVKVDTPDLTDCQQGKYFWVRWRSGKIQVGQVMVPGEHFLMGYTDDSDDVYEIRAAAFAGQTDVLGLWFLGGPMQGKSSSVGGKKYG